MGKKHKKTPYTALRITLITIFSLFVVSVIVSTGVVFAMIKNAPALDVNQLLTLNEPSVLYNGKDEFMDVVVTNEQRTVIPFKDMPQDLKNAFVSIEDERFYKHQGVDLRRITGAIYINVKNKLRGQSSLQGASTITQQLLKNTLLSSEVSLRRKIQEIYLALKLENYLTKDQILEAYMNTIFLGGKAWGVEAASDQYFSKPAKDLNLIQCAFIAGITQSPSVYYPFSSAAKKDPSLYLNRTQTVLMKMYENGYITQQQYNSAVNDLTNKKLTFQPPSSSKSRLNYEWFSLPAIDQIKKDLKSQYRYSDTEIQHLLMYGGLKIYTTMDKDIQDNTKKILDDDNTFGITSRKDKNGIIQPQASAVIMDYHNGEVKAIIGGRGAQPPMSFNRAASDKYLVAPGSSIKPLTVYGAAIDSKQASAATSIEDSPFPDNIAKLYGQSGNSYPRNDNGEYGQYGETITLRTAITHSVNTIAAKLEHEIGLKTGAEYAEKFGLTLDPNDKVSVASLSLGELTHGTNTLTMAAAYGVFGNNGLYSHPKLYRKVVDRTGKIILENKSEAKKILSPESAYIMFDLLKGPVSSGGTGPNANFGSMPVRGKTGTSGDKKNLWFCGLTPYYSAAVWIGNDDRSPIGGNEKYNYEWSLTSNAAAGVWSAIMQSAHGDLPPKDIEMPSDIVSAAICSKSGKIATSLCYGDPNGSTVYTELFISGTEPKDYCNLSHTPAKSNSIIDKILKPFKDKTDINTNKETKTNNKNTDNKNTNTNNTNVNNANVPPVEKSVENDKSQDTTNSKNTTDSNKE
ncbi:PBP1A family penicillin-binding protein [Clostridium sp. OS1-26]|uniref:transglycosylase domain-containing protein n=1 Tax=Clostridium sp. OS1-26 TaxID=3070681 RepID=UPI0027DF90B8|nr:PBP1A family penicillin-binding protein [Clostridium sp. OS1-26]WML35778.1 PBP1A family penicillin-binding protein [Clostridium sp. OS1-26]